MILSITRYSIRIRLSLLFIKMKRVLVIIRFTITLDPLNEN